MTVTLDATGLQIQTFDEILAEIVTAIGSALDLTPIEKARVQASVQSTLGNLARIDAEREAALQEALLAVYETLSFDAEGAHLDRVVALLGVTREPALLSTVIGTATGTPTTSIPNGTRLRYEPELTTWVVVDGPYTIGGGGTVEVTLESESSAGVEVALDPDTGFDDWTVLDTVPGFDAFESTQQPATGTPVETDAALRTRARIEAFSRGQGPLLAIEAAISKADEGVSFVRVWENRTLVTDADDIPGKALNAVVDGGEDQAIAEAIFVSRPAGAEVFALEDGSEVMTTVTDAYGFSHSMPFNRVTEVDMWIRCTLTTSTSETTAPDDLTDLVAAVLLVSAPLQFGLPGTDVLPYKLRGAVAAQGFDGIDEVVIELSLNGSSWSTAKRSISIREKAVFAEARITVLED